MAKFLSEQRKSYNFKDNKWASLNFGTKPKSFKAQAKVVKNGNLN